MREVYVAGLDVGTTKVCALVVRAASGGRPAEVVGFGVSQSRGIRKGVVVDMESAARSIREAVSEAERTTGLELNEAYIGTSGEHVEFLKSYGATGIKGKEVTARDIARVVEAASTLYVPLDREVLHVLPMDFIIDGQDGIVRPMGMSGVRLEANVSVITGSHAAVENLVKCCRKAGLAASGVVFGPMASARAVLRPDEEESSVVVVDVGGGKTDIALYRDGTLRGASTVMVGGNHVTSDISIGLKLSLDEAERIKRRYGYAVGDVDISEVVETYGMDGSARAIPRGYLGEIIMPRCEEIFSMVKAKLSGCLEDEGPICLILTGGGVLLKGADRVAEAVIGLPARIGSPGDRKVFSGGQCLSGPEFATAAGLVLEGMEAERSAYDELVEGVFGKVRGWSRRLMEAANWSIGLR